MLPPPPSDFAGLRLCITSIVAILAIAIGPHVALATVPTSPNIHLDWDGCTASATSNRDFACDTDTGEDVLVASFTADELPDAPAWFTFSVWFESGTTQPSWWQVYPGGCRAGALRLDELPPAPSTCLHFPSSLFAASQQSMTDGASLTGFIQLAQPNPPERLLAGEDYFLFNMRLQHPHTANADSCSGCRTPMYIYFRELVLVMATPGLQYTYDGFVTPKATWQVPAQVPTRNTTWGRLKSLYR